jgi:uncharacterized protein YjbI with pentapeptide repeats
MAMATWALRAPGILLLASALLGAGVPTNCTGCDFGHMDMQGMDMRNVNYTGANLRGSNLRDADLRGGKFTGVDFSDTQLHGARVDGAKFLGVDFKRADVSGVHFDNDNVIGADFSDANLEGTSFRNAAVCWYNNTTINGVVHEEEAKCLELAGARVRGADFTGVRICRHASAAEDCSPVDAATLRNLSHNDLEGAKLP